ncbi:MAG TPA: DivIVA domain-containing protein [Acidimicrobiales bacterium]|nr:DivIVA domain-containing protein [Acidimicrobiales bacterium]
MPDGRPTISSSRISTGDITRHTFAIVRRGFDADEVKAYLQSVARSIEAFEQREQELREALAAADERAAHPVVDEATLSASLGQHSAQILRHAHEEAARIVVEAQDGASSLLREAQNEANEIQARSEGASAERVAEAELMVANTAHEARAEGDQIRAEARAEGDEVITRAKEEGRALLEQVQDARKRILSDLAARRRSLSMQIEQLRAARDEMAAAINGARDSVDTILRDLERTDADARAAALAAGDQARIHGTTEATEEERALGGSMDDVTPVESDEGTAGPPPSVDELFARIRAGTDGERGDASHDHDTAVVATVEDGGVEGPDRALIAQRDELLSPVVTQLARHIKRALGDDQNRMLEILRTSRSAQGDALLGPEDLHLSTFVSAAHGHMADAFVAGAEFAGAHSNAPSDGMVEQSATALARSVVTMLRRRIEEGAATGDDVSETVGAAFREWRGERIERLVGDYAVQAFSAGVAAGTGGGLVRWVLTTTHGCSDCDDNALAGAVPVSEGFPTGHPYPPAHSGCRCLVASATA